MAAGLTAARDNRTAASRAFAHTRHRRRACSYFVGCLPYVCALSLSQPSNEPRAMWASNRVCEAAVRHRKQEQHLHNLRNVKHSVDNKDPRRPKQVHSLASLSLSLSPLA